MAGIRQCTIVQTEEEQPNSDTGISFCGMKCHQIQHTHVFVHTHTIHHRSWYFLGKFPLDNTTPPVSTTVSSAICHPASLNFSSDTGMDKLGENQGWGGGWGAQ